MPSLYIFFVLKDPSLIKTAEIMEASFWPRSSFFKQTQEDDQTHHTHFYIHLITKYLERMGTYRTRHQPPPPPPQTSHFQEDIAREKHTSWRAESGCTSKRARTLQLHIACERLKIWNCRAWRRGEKKNRVSTPCETLNWSYFSFRREGRRRPTKYIKKE